jgi:hypothetical protein
MDARDLRPDWIAIRQRFHFLSDPDYKILLRRTIDQVVIRMRVMYACESSTLIFKGFFLLMNKKVLSERKSR